MRNLGRLLCVAVFLGLVALGGAFKPAAAVGNCWNTFEGCHIACGGDSQCELGCECTYCVCARLLCPQECSQGQF